MLHSRHLFASRRWRIPHDALWMFGALLALLHPSAVRASLFDDIGRAELTALLGENLPTGTDVPVSLVEAPTGTPQEIANGLGRYFPDQESPEFEFTVFTDGSGKMSNGTSVHSTNQAQNFFGNSIGIAPQALDVTVYEANDFLQNVIMYRTSTIPAAQDFRVQNHSWVGTFADNSPPDIADEDNVRALQKFDYILNTANAGQGMTAAVGLNNNLSPVPYLLAHSYNAIAVGRSDGLHSTGLTQTPANFGYGPGRSKPDLVAPRGTTSGATSTVSGVAAMIYEAVAGTAAENSETVKAILMAGATKTEFASWSRSSTQPFDDTYGAGEVNVLHSYRIQLGGQFAGSSSEPLQSVGAHGWDYQDLSGDLQAGDRYYRLEVPADAVANEVSILLTWNHPGATAGSATYNPATVVKNLDLAFYDSTGGFLQTTLDQSVSAVDNVEHIYLRDNPLTSAFEGLLPGVYTLRVSGAAGWDYGLAWRTATQLASYDEQTQTLTPLVNADFDLNGTVDGNDFLIWQRNEGSLVNASHAQGDADGDGDVDADDLLGFNADFGPVPMASVLAASIVPEPGSLILCAAALTWLIHRRRCSG